MVADADTFSGSTVPNWSNDFRVGLVCEPRGPSQELLRCLQIEGVPFGIADDAHAYDVKVLDLVEEDRPGLEALVKRHAHAHAPIIGAVSWEHLRAPDLNVPVQDFIVVPWRPGELTVRLRRLMLQRAPADEPGVIRAEDLVIDPTRYDVFLAGRPVLLTFKEYELLKLLAANPGRVYSREALLEQVWGYQYFGGTRTVDVHIRRLRSKIEDATHTFIDTVWNVGYRFRG